MNLQRVWKSSMLPSTTFLFHVSAPALRFILSVRCWEALRGFESLMRQSLIFFCLPPVTFCLCLCLSSPHLTGWHQSLVLSRLLKLQMTLHSGRDTCSEWHTTADEQSELQYGTYMTSRPEAETGLSRDGKIRMGSHISKKYILKFLQQCRLLWWSLVDDHLP